MKKSKGFKTKSVLCQPVRSMRGGGPVIAVLQMSNKLGGADRVFDSNDEQALASCSHQVAEDIGSRFKDLMTIAEKFSSNAIFVGSKGGEVAKKMQRQHSDSTIASSSKAVARRDSKSTLDETILPKI